MAAKSEKHNFKSEARRVLEIVVHSLYSNKEIFLRELVSNSSDAIDKRRFAALTDTDLSPADDYEIRMWSDAEARTLTVWDNGVGMTRDEAIEDLGTIARSGTRSFVEQLEESGQKDGEKGQASLDALIGQFGVGFYASFMVADEVTVITRKAGEESATRWHSTGDGSFEVSDDTRDEAGTTVTLHLTRVTLAKLITRGMTLDGAMEAGDVRVEGDADLVRRLLASAEGPGMMFAVVEP